MLKTTKLCIAQTHSQPIKHNLPSILLVAVLPHTKFGSRSNYAGVRVRENATHTARARAAATPPESKRPVSGMRLRAIKLRLRHVRLCYTSARAVGCYSVWANNLSKNCLWPVAAVYISSICVNCQINAKLYICLC